MYLPFVGTKGKPVMGLQPLDLQEWIEVGPSFAEQCNYKNQLLAHRYADVFAALAGTRLAQQEVLDLLLEHLIQRFPDIYRMTGAGKQASIHQASIHNVKSQQIWRVSEFAESPLDLAARLVQEDLCLMMPAETGLYELVAASVCFPLRWKLREKISQPMGQIHKNVPDYDKRLKTPVDKVFSKLRVGYPGLRFNWSVVDSPELHLTQEKHVSEFNPEITEDNIEQTLWLRVERQTLRRLPTSGGVLFTIRTYVYSMAAVMAVDGAAGELAKAIRLLSSNMQKYKNLLPFRVALLSYLDAKVLLSSGRVCAK
ncbi:MAG: DUF3445 domain-containing protein [Phormidesmis sp.]